MEPSGTVTGVGGILRDIADDVKAIARDEVDLAKLELRHDFKRAALDAAMLVLAGVILLIGIAMLSTSAVVALAPLIPALWLRLVIMAAVYIVAGYLMARVFVRRLGQDAPDLKHTRVQASRTIKTIREELSHA